MDFEKSGQLKNYIREETKRYDMNSNYGYNYFFCRQFLMRLFEQKEKFSLRGSFGQLAVLKHYTRPLTDIDIITFDKIENVNNCVDNVIKSDYSNVRFQIKQKFVTTNATIAYRIMCYLDNIEHLITLDLHRDKFCDTLLTEMPCLFSKDSDLEVSSVTLEEHIAAKLFTIISNLYLNKLFGKSIRRLKDFYDISKIMQFQIDWDKVFFLLNRKIKNDEFLNDYNLSHKLFDDNFINENMPIWQKESAKYQFDSTISFSDSVEVVENLVAKRR